MHHFLCQNLNDIRHIYEEVRITRVIVELVLRDGPLDFQEGGWDFPSYFFSLFAQ